MCGRPSAFREVCLKYSGLSPVFRAQPKVKTPPTEAQSASAHQTAKPRRYTLTLAASPMLSREKRTILWPLACLCDKGCALMQQRPNPRGFSFKTLLLCCLFFAGCSLLRAERLPIKIYTSADGLGSSAAFTLARDTFKASGRRQIPPSGLEGT